MTDIPGGNDNFTKSLLHMDGANAGTTFTDNNAGGAAHTWTPHGNAQTSTTQIKFGSSSGSFDGTNSYIDTPDSANFKVSNSDFALDFWVRFNAVTGSGQLYGKRASGGTNSICVFRTTTDLAFYASSNGSTWDIASDVSIGTAATGAWNHVAVTRSGSTWKTFYNGTQASTFSSAATVNDDTTLPTIGAEAGGTANFHNGWIDEFRLSVGIARWTANFSVPTSAYSSPYDPPPPSLIQDFSTTMIGY